MRSPRRRPGRFRFEAPESRFEILSVRIVTALVQLLLLVALLILLFVSLRMLRAHFLTEWGGRAWILPASIALILLFLVFRFGRYWRKLREELRPGKDDL